MPSLLDIRRTAAALMAVAMSTTLIAFTLIVSNSFTAQIIAGARASVGDADVVVLPEQGKDLAPEAAQTISAAPGVAGVRPYIEEYIFLNRPGTAHDQHAFVLDVPVLAGSTRLMEGRLPGATGEIAVSPSLAQSQSLGVGDTTSLIEDPSSSTTPSTATIVGIIQPGADITRVDPRELIIFATAEERSALGLGTAPAALYVTGKDGTSTGDLVNSVRDAAGSAQVYPADDIVVMRAQRGNSIASATLYLLTILGPVCAVVAAIVIATTFTTLVARQTRITGLLRCVGASRRQVRLAVLRMALLTGLIGSALGAGVGAGLTALLAHARLVDGLEPQYLTITWTSLALAIALGTLVTLVATLRPARQAGRVSPLIALTGRVAGDRALSRRRLAAAIVGAVIAVGGAAILIVAMRARTLELMAMGAVALISGVLVALPLLVVGASRLVELLSGVLKRPVLQLAARNLARNPGRAAATTAALLVSVVVASTMATALSSIGASLDNYLDNGAPIDIRVEGMTADQDTDSITEQVRNARGVADAVLVPELNLHLSSTAGANADDDHDIHDITVHVVDEAAVDSVIRSHHGLEGLDDQTLIVGGIYDLPEGTSVTLTGPAGSATLTVHVEEGGFGPVITPAVAQQLAGTAPTPSALWVRTSGDGMDEAPTLRVREALRGTGLLVTGSADAREAFAQQIRRVAVTVGAILGLAVLISLSGLTNTTDVSVLERTHEVGLMRATGSGRGQVRGLFIAEALLTAVLGGVIGVVLGTVLGLAGVTAVMGSQDGSGLTLQIPWLELAGILLITGAVGVLASLRPAGRAGAVAPVAALAAD